MLKLAMTPASIFSLSAVRQLEQQCDAIGLDLMTQAASAIKNWVDRHMPPGCRILIAAGPGNNGGDALNAARQLTSAGYIVDILLPRPATSKLTRAAVDTLTAQGVALLAELPNTNPGWKLIIDGLFGIGVTRSFDHEWVKLINQLNMLNIPICSLDTPSGLDPWTGTAINACIRAQFTLTFLCHKPGLFMSDGADLAGLVELANLDYPLELAPKAQGELNSVGAAALIRRRNSHKGVHGTVVIEGGAASMEGAALLAGRAAYAAGAGKVHLILLSNSLLIDPLYPELMLHSIDTPRPEGDILAIGPGLGRSNIANARLAHAIIQTNPLVLDADALNLIAASPTLAASLATRQAQTIITPHPAEAARLLSTDTLTVQRNRLDAACSLARQFRAIVVLKGAGSLIVCQNGYFRINTSGGPALATAGQGDVLTGLIAALWAQQGLTAFDAASLAVRIHGLASDDYTQETGGPIGLMASDTARRASAVLNRLLTVP